MRDTADCGTSSLHTEEFFYSGETKESQAKKQVREYLDKLVEEKLSAVQTMELEEERLNQILREKHEEQAELALRRADRHRKRAGEKKVCRQKKRTGHWTVNHGAANHWVANHRKALAIAAGSLAIAIVALAVFLNGITAYEYTYDGRMLGLVKHQKDVYEAIDGAGGKLSENYYGAEIIIDKDKDISFKRVMGFHLKVNDQNAIYKSFAGIEDMKVNAYAIHVNGEPAAVVGTRTVAEEVLEEVQKPYVSESESVTCKSVDFIEDVKIVKFATRAANVRDGDTAVKNLLNEGNPLVTVRTVEVATYMEAVPFEISYEKTTALYKDEHKVKATGKNGQKKITAEICRENGKELQRNILETELIADPVNQVVLKGTLDRSQLVAKGSCIYPTRGRLSSGFGSRWGRTHYGVDLAAPTGTPIVAADKGTVISAGYEKSFGNVVRLDHGGGIVTVYAHCSKIHVKMGQAVKQGEKIASVGSTGNSTGPHCHFEVRVNGVAKDPMKYLQ